MPPLAPLMSRSSSPSIPVRFDCGGNSPKEVWSVEQVLEQWRRRHCYEIAFTSDEDLAVLFGDIDVETPADMTEEAFAVLDEQHKTALETFIGGHTLALATASSYSARKISWRFYVPDLVGTAKAQKEWANEVVARQGIVLPDGTPIKLDLSVYHKGRKMRMLHAWKQTKDEDNNLIDDEDLWENRPLRLVVGDEKDTMLHRIRANAEQMPSSTHTAPQKKGKKQSSMTYDEFGIVRKLVLECLADFRAEDYGAWRNAIWAIKGTEDSDRALELAHDFSKKSSRYDFAGVERVWKDGNGKLSAGSIHYWARGDNPLLYATLTTRVPVEFLEENIHENDVGLARIFCRVYEDIVVSIPAAKRSYWAFNSNTGLWAEQSDDFIITLFTTNIKNVLTPLAVKLTKEFADDDNDEGKEAKKKINNVLTIIRSTTISKTASRCLPQINTLLMVGDDWTTTHLNSKKDILPVENGVLELRTGLLRPYEMTDYLTTKVAVAYDASANTDLQDRFFNDVLHADTDAISYIQYFLGYCLSGETSLQKLLILEGSEDGANGKSVLMECMLSVLGKSLYTTMNRKALTNDVGQNNDSLYYARFARVVCVPELNKSGNNIDEGLIKNITGDEEINVSAKFKSNISFHPQFKVCIPLNEMFPIPSNSGAVWRRLIVMPFKVRFLSPDHHEWDDELVAQRLILPRDETFARALRADKAGWLAWLAKGASAFYKTPNAEPPRSLQQHLIKKQEENDTFLSYISANYKITDKKEDYIAVAQFAEVCPNPEREKDTVVARRIGVAMKKCGVSKGTRDVYPVRREHHTADDGAWSSRLVEDKEATPVKTKVWFGLRLKTAEEREEA